MVSGTFKNFDLRTIAESGQCFRLNEVENGEFVLIAQGKMLIMEQDGDRITFYCSRHQYEKRWHRYFDLNTDYGAIIETANKENPNDELVSKAVEYAPGMRILRQEVWETIISFIVSQNKNIPAIKSSIEKICELYGNFIGEYKGNNYYSFPSPYSIVSGGIEKLRTTGVGYRAEYIMKTAESVIDGSLDMVLLQKMSYIDSMKYLMSFIGIGPKVANCIALYGLHHLEAFPKDVWMKRMIDEDYKNITPKWVESAFVGAIQQYTFYYKRIMQKGA